MSNRILSELWKIPQQVLRYSQLKSQRGSGRIEVIQRINLDDKRTQRKQHFWLKAHSNFRVGRVIQKRNHKGNQEYLTK